VIIVIEIPKRMNVQVPTKILESNTREFSESDSSLPMDEKNDCRIGSAI
jgi:hypothetical protein